MIVVKNLSVSFHTNGKTLKAVRNVSFSLKEGERLGIVGESGSGKSALVKTLVKLNSPLSSSIDSGEVWYKGVDLMRCTEREMQKIRGKEIGMIFQDPMTSLNPTLQVGFQIREGFLHHHPHASQKEAEARILELLKLVGIAEPELRMHDYPHTLSGGLRQRIMIALALAAQPQILIADEPTTALDVTVQAQILELMRTIQHNKSIILITHDLSVVAGFCDRVLVMYAGEIIEDASVENLFYAPRHPYTRRLLESIPRLDLAEQEPLLSIPGSLPDLTQPTDGCAFCPRCTLAMNICRTSPPPLFEIEKEHKSACWKHDARAPS